MAYLFPVELRGVGTVDIESLGSYIHRLAYTHGVTARSLIHDVFLWCKEDGLEFTEDKDGPRATDDLSAYVRPNETTKEAIQIFEHVTGRKDLASGTFIAVNDAFDRSSGMYISKFRWCPVCMQEFERAGDEGYFKLIWHLKSITHCNIHGAKLISKCPHCNSYQKTFGHKTECVKCQNCNGSLSGDVNTDDVASSWELQGSDLIDLVESIARNAELTFPADGVREVVSHHFDIAWESKKELEFWKLLPRDESIRIADGTMPVTLKTARKVAYKFGMKLSDLLMGVIKEISGMLDVSWTDQLPEDLKPKKRKKNHNRENILEHILNMIDENRKRQPHPLKAVAEVVGVSTGYLHYHFPIIAKKITDSYKEWQAEQLILNRRKAKAVALQLLTDGKAEGIIISRKQALRTLREATDLPKHVLRNAINEVYEFVWGEKYVERLTH